MTRAERQKHGYAAALPHIRAAIKAYRDASAIEARRAETQGGSVEDESAVPKADAQ